MPNNYYNNVTI